MVQPHGSKYSVGETVQIQYQGIEFSKVNADSIYLGTDKGGWIYSGQRPRHEVRCPDFYVMKSVLTEQQILGIITSVKEKPGLDGERLEELCIELNQGFDSKQFGLSQETNWHIRCPSEAEWRCAHEQIQLNLNPKKIEILADGVSDNYRGAMMDGRPRVFRGLGPMAKHLTAIETHPTQAGVTALSSVPMDRYVEGVIARLVITPVRPTKAKVVPDNADLVANIRGEMFWTFLLGVVPSFVIPIARGMGSYAVEGWANLLFGGLCAGFVTGALWRPRRPTFSYEDGEDSIIADG
jgi:hypothetical protein